VEHLHREYYTIFGAHGNRNAASHLWSSFVLDRARTMSLATFERMMAGFCAVSGSIVRPNGYNRYRLNLPTADGQPTTVRGYMHYCCWPCVCDTQDFIKADTLTLNTTDEPRQLWFAVLGDPCKNEAQLDVPFVQPFGHRMTTLKREAPAVVCEEGQGRRLQGATYSDHGHIIVSLLFDAETMGGEGSTGTGSGASALVGEAHTPTPGRLTQDASGKTFQDESEFLTMCATRAAQGYNSGMGEIFRKVAAITPIAAGAAVAHGRAADETNVSPKAAADLGVCDVDQ